MLLFSPDLFKSSGKQFFFLLFFQCKSFSFWKHTRGNCSLVEMCFSEEDWLIWAFEDHTSRDCRCKCRKFWDRRGSGTSSDKKFKCRRSEKGLEKHSFPIHLLERVNSYLPLKCLNSLASLSSRVWAAFLLSVCLRFLLWWKSAEEYFSCSSLGDNLLKRNLLFSNCIYMHLGKGQAFLSALAWAAKPAYVS